MSRITIDTSKVSSLKISDTVLKSSNLSAYLDQNYKKKNVTAFEVYPTAAAIPAGTSLSDDSLLGSSVLNDTVLSSQTLKQDIPVGMTQVFEMYSYVPKDEQDVTIYWGELDDDGNEYCTSLKYDPVSEDFEEYDSSGVPTLNNHNSIMSYRPTSGQEYYIISICHTYKSPGRKKVIITGNNYFCIRGYIAYSFPNDYYPNWQATWRPKCNLISNGMSDKYPLAENVKNVSSLFYNAKRLISIYAAYQFSCNVENYTNLFNGCGNLLKFVVDDVNFFIKNIYTAALMCAGAKNLMYTNIKIPAMATVTGFAKTMFTGLSALDVDINTLIPAGGFKMKKMSVSSLFSGCSSLYGTVPAHLLWDDTSIQFTDTASCFKNCSEEIRVQVPESWGGSIPDYVFFDWKLCKISNNLALMTQRGEVKKVYNTDFSVNTTWTFNTPTNDYAIRFSGLASTEDDANRFISFEPGEYYQTPAVTSVEHIYADAGEHTVVFGNAFYNAKPVRASLSCITDVDVSRNHNFKFIDQQFAYTMSSLTAIHGVLSDFVGADAIGIFTKCTFDNLDFMSTISGINQINTRMFYYNGGPATKIANASYLNELTGVTSIGSSAFRLVEMNICNLSATQVSSIGQLAFNRAVCLSGFVFPSTLVLSNVASNALSAASSSSTVKTITVSFIGKTEDEIKAAETYPFAIRTGSTISCLAEDGTPLSSFIV